MNTKHTPKASKREESPAVALEELLEHASYIRRTEQNPVTAIAIAQVEKLIREQIADLAKAA